MKIKTFAISLLLMLTSAVNAQDWTDIPNLDLEEDTTDVTTVNDILKIQQRVLSNNNSQEHYTNVWRRRSYFNLASNTATMKSKDGQKEFKNDWGVSMQSGTNYRLHKRPIQNMVDISLDYAWLDLSANHFKNEGTYDSSHKTGNGLFMVPWELEKLEGSYGMNLGPSITVAPFIPLNVKELDHIKLHAYYHIGYNASVLYMFNNSDYDTNPNQGADYTQMANNLKLQWGHGMSTAFGFSVIWKGIGIGYEHRSGSIEYQHINKDDFGDGKTKFNNALNRIYITFRT